ncbi:MAG TPA: hypothetical protein VK866_00320 [Acidimicrobiales bacterium]|nr:hypothetical protein [Acidimicrobiales bacterium]
MTEDPVTLLVPASTEHVRLARVLAATAADDAGFDYEEVEDLRIAVDELCFALLDAGDADGRLELVLVQSDGAIELRGSCAYRTAPSGAPRLEELTEHILSVVVDEHEIGLEGDVGRFVLRKRRV